MKKRLVASILVTTFAGWTVSSNLLFAYDLDPRDALRPRPYSVHDGGSKALRKEFAHKSALKKSRLRNGPLSAFLGFQLALNAVSPPPIQAADRTGTVQLITSGPVNDSVPLAELERAYAVAFQQRYLPRYAEWLKARNRLRSGQEAWIFDETMRHTMDVINRYLDTYLKMIDTVLEESAVTVFSNSTFEIPDSGVEGRDYTVKVVAKNTGNVPQKVKLIVVLSKSKPRGGVEENPQELESPPRGEPSVWIPAGGSHEFSVTFPRLEKGVYPVAAFLVDYDHLPPSQEQFGRTLSQEGNWWVLAKKLGRVIVLPGGTTLLGSVERPVQTNLDSLWTPVDSTTSYVLPERLERAVLRTAARYHGPLEIPIATEWTFAGQVDPENNLQVHYSVTPDSTKGGVPSVPGIPGQTFRTETDLRKATILRYYIDTTREEGEDPVVREGAFAPIVVQEIPVGFFSVSVQFLLDNIPLLPDTNEDGRPDPWNDGKILQVVHSPNEVLQNGSIDSVVLTALQNLVQEDPEVRGEFILPPDVIHRAHFDIPAALQSSPAAPVTVDALLIWSTELRPDDHYFQYELVSPVRLHSTGAVTFPFSLPELIAKGRLVKFEIDTRGTPDEREHRVVGRAQVVDRFERANIANVGFQILLHRTSLLERGSPLFLGRPFTLAEGALRPGSFDLVGHNMNEIGLVISPEALNHYPFQYTSEYSILPRLSPLPEAYALYEMTFTLQDQRENGRPFRSFVTAGWMGGMLRPGQRRTDTFQLEERPIIEVVHGDSVGVVSEIPAGPYGVRISLLDTDAARPIQANDRFDSAGRSGTLFVGGILKAGADTLSAQGLWVVDGDAIYTEEDSASVSYEVDFGSTPATWGLIPHAKNRASLPVPDGYRFNLGVTIDDEFLGHVRIPVDTTGAVRTGGVTLGNRTGVHRIRVQWTNAIRPITLQIEKLLLNRSSTPRGESHSKTSGEVASSPLVVPLRVLSPASSFVPTVSRRFQGADLRPSLQKEVARLEGQLMESLLRIPESQRPMVVGMSEVVEKDLALDEAEKELLALGEKIREISPDSPLVVTLDWLRGQRERAKDAYLDLRFTGLTGENDLTYDGKLVDLVKMGDVAFSPLFGGRHTVDPSEEDRLKEKRNEAQAALLAVQNQIAAGAADSTTLARGIELSEEVLFLENERLNHLHRRNVLGLGDHFYYGGEFQYLPHGTGVAASARFKFYGAPLKKQGEMRGLNERLIGLRNRKTFYTLYLAPPTRYEFLNNVAWHYQNILARYTSVALWDPNLLNLWSQYAEIQFRASDAFQLGAEVVAVQFHSSFEEYVESVTSLPGHAPEFRQSVHDAFGRKEMPLSAHLEDHSIRGSLYWSPQNELSLGAATNFEDELLLRLRGSLRDFQFNASTALAQRRTPQFNLHVVHHWSPQVGAFVSLAREFEEWRADVGVHLGLQEPNVPTPARSQDALGMKHSLTAPIGTGIERLQEIKDDPKKFAQTTLPPTLHLSVGGERREYKGPTPQGVWNRLQEEGRSVAGSVKEPVDQVRGFLGTAETPQDPVAENVDHAIEAMREAKWLEDLATSFAKAAPLHTQSGSVLFMEKIRLLDPGTRRLIGQMKDKVDLQKFSPRGEIRGDEVTTERIVKLYALLAHYFNGRDPVKITLPEGFQLKQLERIDDVMLQTIDQETFEDIMKLAFPESQRKDLERQRRESKAVERQV